MKRLFMLPVLIDNYLTNLFKSIFPSQWKLTGSCLQCGKCCQAIYLKMTPGQTRSPLFVKVAVAWISWLFAFRLLRIDYENHYLIFHCRHLTNEGKCRNYFWRPNVCRNYPLVDYFTEPKFLPGCGFKTLPNTK